MRDLKYRRYSVIRLNVTDKKSIVVHTCFSSLSQYVISKRFCWGILTLWRSLTCPSNLKQTSNEQSHQHYFLYNTSDLLTLSLRKTFLHFFFLSDIRHWHTSGNQLQKCEDFDSLGCLSLSFYSCHNHS